MVRQHWPDAYEPLEASLFRTHWVDGGDLADPATLDRLVRQAGADPAALHELVADGVGRRGLEASMDLAREHGVTATPAWLIDDTLLIPGAQPREAMRRWVTRLQERSTAPKDR